MPKQDPKPSKREANLAYDTHWGGYDPSDPKDNSISKRQSLSPGKSYIPDQQKHRQISTFQDIERNLDTKSHQDSHESSQKLRSKRIEFMEGKPYELIKRKPVVRNQDVEPNSSSINDFVQNAVLQEDGRAGSLENLKTGFHRDFLRRDFISSDTNEMFLNPHDGSLCPLVVQSSQSIQQSSSGATWYRIRLRNGSPWAIRLSNWAMSRDQISQNGARKSLSKATVRWIPACFVLALVALLPTHIATKPTNFGRYDPFLYKDWRYPLAARNKAENKVGNNSNGKPAESSQMPAGPDRRERLVEPDYLCFIDTDGNVQSAKVSEWKRQNQMKTPTDYVFVSFTAQQFRNNEPSNRYLKDVGISAARKAGVNAYWISTSCLYDLNETDEQKIEYQRQQSVWNISDIIRRARAIAIAVSGPLNDNGDGESLKQWGSRVWTMPELLLYSGSDPILIYDQKRGKQLSRLRREIWDKAYEDPENSGQLIDHYEGSLILTPLELSTVALHCLQNRWTTNFLPGDVAYALMGLLRQRPEVVASDSEFQAFARLSLANDSNMLLERMLCLLPRSSDSEWWCLDDAWDARLWDIYPRTQICGLGDDDTVILDGARGATIRWDKFVPVDLLGEAPSWHSWVRWFVRTVFIYFVIGIAFILESLTIDPLVFHKKFPEFPEADYASSRRYKWHFPLGVVLLSLSGIVILLLPYFLRMMYCTKTVNSQPLFYGLEGHLDMHELELLVFGSFEGRLQWSTTASPLSRHELDPDPDIYGLGNRISLYLQWLSAFLVNNALPKYRNPLRAIYLCYSVAVAIAICLLTFAGTCTFTLEVEILYWAYWGGFVCVFASSPSYTRLGPQTTPKWIGLDWTSTINCALHIWMFYHGCFFWLYGYDSTFSRMPCGTYHFFFALFLDPSKGFWIFNKLAKFVIMPYLLIFALLPPLITLTLSSEIKKSIQSSPSYRFLASCLAPLTGNRWNVRIGTNTLPKFWGSWILRKLHRLLYAVSGVHRGVREFVGLPSHARGGIRLITAIDLKRRRKYRIRCAFMGLASLLLSITAIETTLWWNKVSGVNSMATPGQYMNFVVGMGGLAASLWKLFKQEASRRIDAMRRHKLREGNGDIELETIPHTFSGAVRYAFGQPDVTFLSDTGASESPSGSGRDQSEGNTGSGNRAEPVHCAVTLTDIEDQVMMSGAL